MLKQNGIKYKFDFGSSLKLIISYAWEFVGNIGLILISLMIMFALSSWLNPYSNYLIIKIILIIYSVITILADLFFLFMIFIPKNIVLTDEKILVNRFCSPLQTFVWDIRGINDRISYSEISYCQRCTNLLWGSHIPFLIVNEKNVVEIKTKYKTYFLPVKNSEDFIKQVNLRMERIKFLEKYNLNSVIAARGISPEQIKFRWKSQDELESVYYIDYQGNKVDIPFLNNKSE